MKAGWKQGGEFSDYAMRLTDILEGIDLLAADLALDEARRFAWTMNFTGFGFEAVKQHLRPSLITLQIALELSGLNPLEVDELMSETRHLLWVAHFAVKPETLFGRKYAAWVERGKPPVDRTKLI